MLGGNGPRTGTVFGCKKDRQSVEMDVGRKLKHGRNGGFLSNDPGAETLCDGTSEFLTLVYETQRLFTATSSSQLTLVDYFGWKIARSSADIRIPDYTPVNMHRFMMKPLRDTGKDDGRPHKPHHLTQRAFVLLRHGPSQMARRIQRWTSFERYMAVLGKVQNGLRTAILTKVQAYFLPIQLAMYGKYVGGGDKAMKPRAGYRAVLRSSCGLSRRPSVRVANAQLSHGKEQAGPVIQYQRKSTATYSHIQDGNTLYSLQVQLAKDMHKTRRYGGDKRQKQEPFRYYTGGIFGLLRTREKHGAIMYGLRRRDVVRKQSILGYSVKGKIWIISRFMAVMRALRESKGWARKREVDRKELRESMEGWGIGENPTRGAELGGLLPPARRTLELLSCPPWWKTWIVGANFACDVTVKRSYSRKALLFAERQSKPHPGQGNVLPVGEAGPVEGLEVAAVDDWRH
ncbi:hypothetical protein BDV98DRAFT_583776 [Pterulicium gracile]|uniref:Uncharacterized protein n=1 Tax=Pterulicium gracile TaxID=1884261 RepID=A0A5C3QP82_9AGAR|nr:hypothetical protein BDV98DRAFT_583776 [Pterula gracilis]